MTVHPSGPGAAAKARQKAAEKTRILVRVPVLGQFLPGPGDHLELPDKNTLIYAATVGGLVAAEVIEWPVGAALALGHLVSQQRSRSKALAAVEEALADAK